MITAETVKNNLDFGAFYQSEVGELKPGRNGDHLALCCFHEDTDASLSVNLKSGLYLCFGCGAKGDVFNFYQTKHNCDFKSALKELAQRAGVGNGNSKGTKAATGKAKPRIVKTYDYLDAQENLPFQVCRWEPGRNGKDKDFSQRRSDGKGGWIWEMKGVELIPYRLPEVLEADAVGICEGEKDCDALAALGFTATTNPNGAGKWRPEFRQYFKNKKVVIFPDNDDPGRAHAQDVARNLHGIAAVVKIVELPGLPPKGDVSDWLAAGGTAEQLKDLVAAAPVWELQEPAIEPAAATTTVSYSLSDIGNARRLVAQHGQDLHYCHLSRKWWVWNGKVWAVDTTGEVRRRAKQTIATIYGEAGAADEDQRKKIVAHALRSEADGRIKGMLSVAESEPGIPISPAQMDANPWLLNCSNGTVDLKTGALRPHDRADLMTHLAPVEFDSPATCPRWEKFLDHIQKSNQDVISYIQRTLGYSLTGDCREQCLFMLWGSGSNGKSTLLNIISSILGNYAMQTPTETLLAKQKGDIPNDIARLNGPRFVTALEAPQGRRLAESLVKQITGQDTISARFLFGEYFDFKPQFKLFLGTNHKPVIKDTTHSMWRRIRLIPFPVQIPDDEQDKSLPDALLAEAPGILAWMVRGCLSWRLGGLGMPDEVKAATNEYQAEQDAVGNFLKDCCIEAPRASATAKDLYATYTKWAQDNGEKQPLSQRAFGMSLTERGFNRDKGTGNKGIRLGIGVRE